MEGLGETMVKQLLQFCSSYNNFGLSIKCTHCGQSAKAAAPLKWSPEDARASIRRKMNDVGSEQWYEMLPKSLTIQE